MLGTILHVADHDGVEDHDQDFAADPFANLIVDEGRGGTAYGRFLEVFRTLQDRVAAANPPVEVWEELSDQLAELSAQLATHEAAERLQPAGTRLDLPGRGHPLLLPFMPDELSDEYVSGRVVFRRFHLGGNGAAHGGTVPLLFDEILGRLANAGDRAVSRTAYLTVNFRAITPIGVELQLDATLDREEGRKRWLSGRLRDGQTVVADAEGLFLELRTGQP